MSAASYLLGIAAPAVVVVVIFELLRRRQLKERHAVWWLLAAVISLIVGIFPNTLAFAAQLLNVKVSTNLAFFVALALLFLISLQHSAEVTRLENKTRLLAEEVALLRARLEPSDQGQCESESA